MVVDGGCRCPCGCHCSCAWVGRFYFGVGHGDAGAMAVMAAATTSRAIRAGGVRSAGRPSGLLAAGGALLSIPAVGSFAHVSVVPARFYASDWTMLIPVAICVGVGCRIRDAIRRLGFGLAQAVLLICVYSNLWGREVGLGDAYAVLGLWVVLAVGYAVLFWGITSVMRSAVPTRRPGHCTRCGYNLTGNVSGRCPECGTKMQSKRW